MDDRRVLVEFAIDKDMAVGIPTDTSVTSFWFANSERFQLLSWLTRRYFSKLKNGIDTERSVSHSSITKSAPQQQEMSSCKLSSQVILAKNSRNWKVWIFKSSHPTAACGAKIVGHQFHSGRSYSALRVDGAVISVREVHSATYDFSGLSARFLVFNPFDFWLLELWTRRYFTSTIRKQLTVSNLKLLKNAAAAQIRRPAVRNFETATSSSSYRGKWWSTLSTFSKKCLKISNV